MNLPKQPETTTGSVVRENPEKVCEFSPLDYYTGFFMGIFIAGVILSAVNAWADMRNNRE